MLIRQSSFATGEVAPNLYAKEEAAKTGVRTLKNFFATPMGSLMNRPGFQFIASAKSAATKARLIPFTFSSDQAYVLEFGDLYVRVYRDAALVTEVVTPYVEADLAQLEHVQSGDTLMLFHPSHAPRELRRTGATTWTIAAFSTARTITAPAQAPTIVSPLPPTDADATHAAVPWEWVYTAVNASNEESAPSPALSRTGQLAPDRLAFLQANPVTGAVLYYWYRGRYGVWGFVGSSVSPNFVDEGAVPNYSDRPPTVRSPFANNEHPAVGTYFQQRLVVGNQPSYPQRVQASQTGRFHNFDYSIPQKEDDAIDFTVASRQYEEIRALVPLRNLLILTANTEFVVDSDVFSPTGITLVPISYNGCAKVRPLIINDSVLYLQAQQAVVREIAFDSATLKRDWANVDISLVANHLLATAGRTIKEWAYQRMPYSMAWAVRDDGVLLSLTYVRELGVVAWAQHTTDGTFESVCCVPENGEDVLYAVVRRGAARYIERMASRFVNDAVEAVFLDSSVFYSGAPAQVFGSLDHLEGKTVKALRDGIIETHVVTGGTITLAAPASTVVIGLAYDCDVELLDVFQGGDPVREIHLAHKLVRRAVFEVDSTAGLKAGESFTELVPWVAPLGHVTPSSGVMNEQMVVPITSSWNRGGRACLRQSDPLPVTILAAVRELEVGEP